MVFVAVIAGLVVILLSGILFRSLSELMTNPSQGGRNVLQILGIDSPQSQLAIALIGSFLVAAVILAMIFTVFYKRNSANTTQAFGLPEGSIRALIAIVLISMFSISSIFIFQASSYGTGGNDYFGISQTILDKIPQDELASVSKNADGTYNVTRRFKPTDDSQKLAVQLFSTISTLVVSVAAFYFGSSTASSSTRAMSKQMDNLLQKQAAVTTPTAVKADTASVDQSGAVSPPPGPEVDIG